jgi:hypothetical protein
MRQSQVHSKGLLPAGNYPFTISQAYKDDSKRLILCHTIDSGEFAWRHVLERLPVVGSGLGRLKRMCELIGIVWVGDPADDDFPEQFVGFRGTMDVGMAIYGDTIRNVIKTWDVVLGKPEYDVTKERTDDYFFTQKNTKNLPI